MTIQWEELICIARNGEISGYVIQYGEISNMERDEEMIPGTGDEGGVYTITGLTPVTYYIIGIAAFSDSGAGPFAWVTVETLPYGKPCRCLPLSQNYQLFVFID